MLAWGLTIHKSQGLTFPKGIVVDFAHHACTRPLATPGLAFVGMSRTTDFCVQGFRNLPDFYDFREVLKQPLFKWREAFEKRMDSLHDKIMEYAMAPSPFNLEKDVELHRSWSESRNKGRSLTEAELLDLREMLQVRGVRKNTEKYDDEPDADSQPLRGGGGRKHGMGMRAPAAKKSRKAKGSTSGDGCDDTRGFDGGEDEDPEGFGAYGFDAPEDPQMAWQRAQEEAQGMPFEGFDDFDDPEAMGFGAFDDAHDGFDDFDDPQAMGFGGFDEPDDADGQPPTPPQPPSAPPAPPQPPWEPGRRGEWLLHEAFRLAGDQFWHRDDEEVLGEVMLAGLVDHCSHEGNIRMWEANYQTVAAAARQTAAEGGSVRELGPIIDAQIAEEIKRAAERHARGPGWSRP